MSICSSSYYLHFLKIRSDLRVIWLSHYLRGKCVLTQKLKFAANQSDCSVSSSNCSTQYFSHISKLSSSWLRLAKTDLCCWGSVGLEQKDISGCSTARSCISCPCCMSGWAAPASVLPLPARKPRPSGSASGWGSPLPPADYSPCERKSNEHGGSAFTRSCFSYLMCCRRVLLLVFKKWIHTFTF